MSLTVIDPGPLTTVQDLGRFDYQQFGVPVSGAMDGYALRAANELVGNAWSCAALEFTIDGPTLVAVESCLIAVTGVGFEVLVQDRKLPMWTALFVRRNWTIQVIGPRMNQSGAHTAHAGGVGLTGDLFTRRAGAGLAGG